MELPYILIEFRSLQQYGECWREFLRSGTRGKLRSLASELFRDGVFRRLSFVLQPLRIRNSYILVKFDFCVVAVIYICP